MGNGRCFVALKRSVRIEHKEHAVTFGRQGCNSDKRLVGNAPDIPTLRTCRDSRSIALHHFQKSFGRQLAHSIYFNAQTDNLTFENEDSLLAFVSGNYWDQLEDLRKLQITCFCIQPRYWNRNGLYLPNTILIDNANIQLGRLNSWEVVAFACMRLGSVTRVVLQSGVSQYSSRRNAANNVLWDYKDAAEDAMQTFRKNWSISRKHCFYPYVNDVWSHNGRLPSDLTKWNAPTITGLLTKVEGENSHSSWVDALGTLRREDCFLTREEVWEHWRSRLP